MVAVGPLHEHRLARIARILRCRLRRSELERPVDQRRSNLRARQVPCGLGESGGLRSDPDRKRAGEYEKHVSRMIVRAHGDCPFIVALCRFSRRANYFASAVSTSFTQ